MNLDYNSSRFSLDYLFQQDHSLISGLTINGYPFFGLVWNLFLFLIPWFLCLILIRYWQKTKFKQGYEKIIAVVIGFIWLLFIPNTAYVITQVRHLAGVCETTSLYHVCANSAWMIVFLFTYALLGWLAFVYLIRQMHEFIIKIWHKQVAKIYLIVIIPLTALGVLLGLLNRWNSWELFTTPILLFKALLLYVTNWTYFLNWLIFSIFLYILYWLGEKVLKEVKKINKPFK